MHITNAVTGSTVAMDADSWVSSQDFQLVKVAWGEASHPMTTYFHWFPRTKALVAQVDIPQIPAGYRQINTGIRHIIESTPAK